ncbi:right-handed parallel beta-helix repeat-containing protein [Viridibacterium curvum]|uniref:Right-handed parallel beta-helix repeat-containing protein n=1 Tax=Viridibacterium curvum TaxID=1101404 RepID=A0ABP9QJB3_9RHOO
MKQQLILGGFIALTLVSAAQAAPKVTGCGTETSNLTASKVYYVTPTGSDSGAGSSFSAPMSFSAALSKVSAGQMILLQPGTYSIKYTAGAKNTINLSKSGTSSANIYMVAANCGKAKIDFQFPSGTWVQDSFGFYLTGSYWYFKGVEVTRAGYHGAYVTGAHNTFENCAFYDNRNTGLEINKGGSYTTVLNVDSYRNYDPKKHGGMADGFASKQEQGAGNVFYGCRAWENSDDGWDTFGSKEPITIEQSWAFNNGKNLWSDSAFAGNGNGFKLGGLDPATDKPALERNIVKQSVAFGNTLKGFDQNSNVGGNTLYNNIGYKNKINFGFGQDVTAGEKHKFRNNISLSGTQADSIKNADSANNTWNSGLAASSSDFASLDLSLATAARNADGTLPTTNLFRLSSSSKMVNKGVDVGIAYKGSAPDLGPFELK